MLPRVETTGRDASVMEGLGMVSTEAGRDGGGGGGG